MSSNSSLERQESHNTNGTNKSEEFTFTYSGTSNHHQEKPQQQQQQHDHNNSNTSNGAGVNITVDPGSKNNSAAVNSFVMNVEDTSDIDNKNFLEPGAVAGADLSRSGSGILPDNLQDVADEHQKQKQQQEEEELQKKKKAAEEEAARVKKLAEQSSSSSSNNLLSPNTSSVHGRRIRSASGIRKAPPRPSESVQKDANNLDKQNQEDKKDDNNSKNSSSQSNNNSKNDDDVNPVNKTKDSVTKPARDLPWSFSALSDKSCFNSLMQRNVGVTSEQGHRRSMEDQHTALISDECGGDGAADAFADIPYFAVYDGHGGVQCADFLRERLHGMVMKQPNIRTEPEQAIQAAILLAEETFLKKAREEKLEAGSTVALAVIVDGKLIVGNVGDSEIVLSRAGKAKLLTTKHHLSANDNERTRITAAGGKIYRDRVGHPKFNPAFMNIAVTRAIGDSGFKLEEYTDGNPSGLIADAETRTVSLTSQDEFIVIGCDGLWDVISYQDCVDFCRNHLSKNASAQEVTEALVAEALDRGSSDNITVMFVNLRERDAEPLSRSTSVNNNAPVEKENSSARGTDEKNKKEEEEAPPKKTFNVENWDYDGSS